MEASRAVEIIKELEDYDRSVHAGRIMSTVTIGEIVDLAKYVEKATDTIEQLQKDLDDLRFTKDLEIQGLKAELAAEKTVTDWQERQMKAQEIDLDEEMRLR